MFRYEPAKQQGFALNAGLSYSTLSSVAFLAAGAGGGKNADARLVSNWLVFLLGSYGQMSVGCSLKVAAHSNNAYATITQIHLPKHPAKEIRWKPVLQARPPL